MECVTNEEAKKKREELREAYASRGGGSSVVGGRSSADMTLVSPKTGVAKGKKVVRKRKK